MNILFICEIDWLRKPVIDIHWLAESMALLGHKVYIVDYESLWGLDNRYTAGELLVSRAFPKAIIHLIRPRFVRIPVVSRASAFASHYFAIKKAIQEKRIEAIVLYSVPTNGLQTLHWAKHFDVPVVFRAIDVLNQLVPYRILKYPTKLLEKKVYSSVDRILTITPKLSEYVVSMGADPSKVGVLPVPVDTNMFCPSEDGISELRHRWGLSDADNVILFMGTLFNFSGLDGFLPEYARRIIDAKLVIVGDGEQRGKLEQIIRAYGLGEDVIITGFQPYRDIPKYINMADVCINPFIVNDTTRDIFPGKTVQILACGKPLVMRPLDGVKTMISGEEQGVIYAGSNGGMVTEVLSLLRSKELRNKVGENGLKYAREHHDYKLVARQLEMELMGV